MRDDVYADPSGSGLLLDVQSDLLSNLATRVVVPLRLPDDSPPPIGGLNPIFEIAGRKYVMATSLLSAIPAREVTVPVGNLSRHHSTIMNALDFLLSGY
ncbi:MAG TPA: CcdB family protein [Stellaceae bacterium]|nr:CcdB family protein [Stellaceae bacterium]